MRSVDCVVVMASAGVGWCWRGPSGPIRIKFCRREIMANVEAWPDVPPLKLYILSAGTSGIWLGQRFWRITLSRLLSHAAISWGFRAMKSFIENCFGSVYPEGFTFYLRVLQILGPITNRLECKNRDAMRSSPL